MFKIGEFSKLTQVSVRMLRYYDEVGLLKPAEVDRLTGHRMYSALQIPILDKIIYLRDSGFNVSEIAIALEMDNDDLAGQLDKKSQEIEQTIKDEQEKLRKVVPTYYSEGDLWKELADFANKHKIDIESRTFSIFHDTEYREEDVDIELCALVKKLQKNMGEFTFRMTEPVPIMACTMVTGSFSNISGAYKAFAEWLHENEQYRIAGATRQIVHRGPWNESDPDKYLVELQIPLELE